METVLGLEPWLGYLIVAAILTYTLSIGGWVLAKAGRSPLWILLLLVPYLNVIAFWAFAFARWPAVDGAAKGAARGP
ncbi:hypothetical protein HL658_32810 [Azospirillum sp. RWY-5-1]|uniref:DUF5652 domain-containing protein n=1 Tax=Azospirillum oleiclasticum TaxID=2735135 RepID=A0ABX2TMP1_9PROT|nr:hypothetical protein [Azospirillum oleiclasticum]NYZ17350.1 hypothetical protein [Azospirillum oleiclasticum]NYZ24708.1 hypothetical protein [Azospirillum oleiclasticum]